MTTLYLVRHGQTDSNKRKVLQGQSDGVLNQEGIKQAEHLGVHLKSVHFDRIIASDLIRAKQTAQLIADHHSIEVEINPLVREWNCGTLDGLPAQALFKALAESQVSIENFRPPEGETLQEVQIRARNFLKELEKDSKDLSVVICSHGDFLRMLISVLMGTSIQTANEIHLNNTSYSIFKKVKGEWYEDSINNLAD